MAKQQYKMTKYTQKNCVLIRNDWADSGSVIQVVGSSYQNKQNFLTDIIGINYDKEKYPYQNLKEGDMVFLSKYYKAIKPFKLGDSEFTYYNLPMLLVMGTFRNSSRTLNSLEIFDDKVLVEEIQGLKTDGGIFLPDQKDATIGKVIKTGKGGFLKNWKRRSAPLVKEGDIVLFWNNVGTPVTINGKKFTCIEDNKIIGNFSDGLMNMDFLNILDGRILLKPAEMEELSDSKIILAKALLEEDQEMSSIPDNRFKVVKVSEKGREINTGVFEDMEGLKENDIVIIDPAALNYVDFRGQRYFTSDDLSFISGVIEYEKEK